MADFTNFLECERVLADLSAGERVRLLNATPSQGGARDSRQGYACAFLSLQALLYGREGTTGEVFPGIWHKLPYDDQRNFFPAAARAAGVTLPM